MVGHTEPTHTPLKPGPTPGFTIVELLVVIVVIGILLALIIAAFNGVQARARDAQMKTDLSSVYKKLMVDKALGTDFPSSLSVADGGKGIAPSSGGSYQYTVNNSVSPATFCVSFVKNGSAFYINENNQVVSGVCPGHSLTGYMAPTMTGYSDFSPNSGTGYMDITPSTSIPDGSWMIVVITYVDDVYPSMPAGWTTLLPRNSAGTMRNSVFAKIKTSSDTFPTQITIASSSASANGVLFWGDGAGPVSSWIFGPRLVRDGSTAGQFKTDALSITTTVPQSLILALSNERTTANETDISSIVNATKWFFIPQIGSTKIQTITVSSFVQVNPGATPVVTVTYPNSQINNGLGIQIALPPR